MSIDAGTWRGIFTILIMGLFFGIVFWAYSKNRKQDFEEAAQLPLEERQPDDT